jgi:hypothetical protein
MNSQTSNVRPQPLVASRLTHQELKASRKREADAMNSRTRSPPETKYVPHASIKIKNEIKYLPHASRYHRERASERGSKSERESERASERERRHPRAKREDKAAAPATPTPLRARLRCVRLIERARERESERGGAERERASERESQA